MPVFLRDKICECVVKNREDNEEQREWLKRCMCMFHWMQTDYYQFKLQGEGQQGLPFGEINAKHE